MTRLAVLSALLLLPLAAPAAPADWAIAPYAWFQRDFDTNFKLCAVRKNQPEWCPAWIDAVEAARPKTDDMTLEEWLRRPFPNYILTCSTLLPPTWCPDWYAAMKELTDTPEYREPADALAAERIRDLNELAAAARAWKQAVAHAAANKMTDQDMALIREHIAVGDAGAMELLAWMYANGQGVPRDYTRAYEFYGRAVLAGREDLRPQLVPLWKQLNETQRNEINAIFKALAGSGSAPR